MPIKVTYSQVSLWDANLRMCYLREHLVGTRSGEGVLKVSYNNQTPAAANMCWCFWLAKNISGSEKAVQLGCRSLSLPPWSAIQ